MNAVCTVNPEDLYPLRRNKPMSAQYQRATGKPEKQGWWATVIADFRVLWTTIVLALLVGSALAAASYTLAHAAFSGGYRTYGLAYVATGIFIQFSLPIAMFLMQRRKS